MNKNDLVVSYFPSDLCNFNCDYCYRTSYRSNMYIASKSNIDNMFINLSNNNIKTFRIMGGEPLMYPYIKYLLDSVTAYSNIYSVKLLTNGSQIDKFLSMCVEYPNITFEFSIHPKQSHFSEDILKRCLKFKNIKYRIVCDFRFYNKLIEYTDLLKKYNVSFDCIDIIINNSLDNEFSSSSLFQQFYYDIYNITYPIIDYTNCYCYNNIIKINPNGNIFFDECHMDKTSVFNVYKNKYEHTFKKVCCIMKTTCSWNCRHTYHE